jgi:hypothetical protein
MSQLEIEDWKLEKSEIKAQLAQTISMRHSREGRNPGPYQMLDSGSSPE